MSSFHARSAGNAATRSGAQQEHFLILGGPGVGKTFFVKCLLKRLADQGSSAAIVAFTGAAAVNVPSGRTIHSMFNIPIHAKTGQRLSPLDGPEKQALTTAMEGKAFLLIDEVSMVSTALLGMMDERLRQVLNSQLPFGGISVIALGDFYQLQPCGGSAFFTAVMDLCTGQRPLGRPDDYAVHGTALFKTFKLFELKTQMRAREDSQHGAWVDAFRSGIGLRPVTSAFIDLLKTRLLRPADAIQDPSWAWATIAVTSNMEKVGVDWRQAKSFALAHRVPVVVWKQQILSPTFLANQGRGGVTDDLYRQEPALMGLFVKGAPAYLTKNFPKPGLARGLANGTTCVMHSITFREDTDEEKERARVARNRIDRARPGEVVDLGDLVPLSINVEHTVSAEEASCWPMGGSLVCPIINRAANIGTVVVPILCNHSDAVHTRAAGGSTGWPGGEVTFKCHSVAIAFAITFHKLQGKTIPKVILDLRKRPGSGAGIMDVDFEGLYVGWTRVRKGADIRVIPSHNGAADAFDHLMSLGPSAHLLCWLKGFDYQIADCQARTWRQDLAVASWRALAESGSVPTTRAAANRQHLSAESVLSCSEGEIRRASVNELRSILRSLGLSSSGNKSVLISALMLYRQAQQQGGLRVDAEPGRQHVPPGEPRVSARTSRETVDNHNAQTGRQRAPVEDSRDPVFNINDNIGPVSFRPLPVLPVAQVVVEMPPRCGVYAIGPVPHVFGGGLHVVHLGTLSWFWVPVIAHATQAHGNTVLPQDSDLHSRGAIFSLSALVTVVRQLLMSGRFVIYHQEMQHRAGFGLYFSASAQDRLYQLLAVTHPQLAQDISNWWDHLYASDVRQLSMQHAHANTIAIHALGWPPHFVRLPSGQRVLVPGSGLSLVWVIQP